MILASDILELHISNLVNCWQSTIHFSKVTVKKRYTKKQIFTTILNVKVTGYTICIYCNQRRFWDQKWTRYAHFTWSVGTFAIFITLSSLAVFSNLSYWYFYPTSISDFLILQAMRRKKDTSTVVLEAAGIWTQQLLFMM